MGWERQRRRGAPIAAVGSALFALCAGCAARNANDTGSHGPGAVDPVAGAGEPELVVGGFNYLEGPAWDAATQSLLFVDQKDSHLYRLTPPKNVNVLVKNTRNAGGLVPLGDGSFAMVQSAASQVSRLSGTGTISVVAGATDQGPLDQPNDLTARKDGTLYLTEPFRRQVVRVAPDGKAFVEWQGAEGTKPNGIALSPDQKTLYVSDTLQNMVRAFDVAADGRTSGERVFASGLGMDRDSIWVSDGMTVDEAGNVYVASYPRPDQNSPGEIAVFAANGARWGRLVIPLGPTNCTFGGADNRTLWITAQGAVYRVALPLAGLHP